MANRPGEPGVLQDKESVSLFKFQPEGLYFQGLTRYKRKVMDNYLPPLYLLQFFETKVSCHIYLLPSPFLKDTQIK